MRRTTILLTLVFVSFSMAGCGGSSSKAKPATSTTSSTSVPSSVPKPNLAKIVPANYVVQKIQYAKFSNQKTPDAVIVSKGPATGDMNFHPAELQVISWDAIAERWNVIYDAQKDKEYQVQYGTSSSNEYITAPPDSPADNTPILDRTAEGDVNKVAFVRFGDGNKLDLVFSATQTYGGSGSPGNIVVIGFDGGVASLRYIWFGDGGADFTVAGSGAKQTLAAAAQFWTPVDAHCCPIRSYSFVIGEGAEHTITSLRDDRPWLGLFVKAQQENESSSPLEVVDVVDGSPGGLALPGRRRDHRDRRREGVEGSGLARLGSRRSTGAGEGRLERDLPHRARRCDEDGDGRARFLRRLVGPERRAAERLQHHGDLSRRRAYSRTSAFSGSLCLLEIVEP